MGLLKFGLPAAIALLAIAGLVSGISLASFHEGVGVSGASGIVQLNLGSDICVHDPYIFPNDQPPPHNLHLLVEFSGDQNRHLTISGPAPWVTVTGDRDQNGDFLS